MTRSGKLLAFTRHGISKLSSLMERVSFETSIPIISDATLTGEKDDMFSPISNLMVGQKLKCGTGIVDLIPIIEGINDMSEDEDNRDDDFMEDIEEEENLFESNVDEGIHF